MPEDLQFLKDTLSDQSTLVFERIFDLIPVPVLITRKNESGFEPSFVNKKFKDTIGYTLEEIPTVEAFLERAYPDPDYRQQVLSTWYEKVDEALLNNSEVDGFPAKVTFKSGEEQWFQVKAAIWAPEFNVTTYIDIDDIKMQKRSLERLNLLKDKMIAVISHDFRTPLITIKGLMNLLMGEKIKHEELKVLVPSIVNQLNVAFNLLDDLLVWAKNQFDNDAGKLTSFDISQVINDCISHFLHAASMKEITLNILHGNADIVTTDKELVKLTVRNILSNAIKFTHKKGEIHVSHYVSDKHLVISIKDNGVGMSEQQITSMFSKQYTFKSSGTNNEVGSGIGIILCQEALEKMNGKLTVLSEQGNGSEFIIEIPVSDVQAQ